ncbi:MAG TPA: hypothetical protein VJN18_09745 [Polyangiaceae bacterium]|nr:hypothetical protein [Polyangiaceae bacterium]
MSRAIAFSWGLGLVLVAASPMLQSPLDDGFPLSTFPMFAEPLAEPMFYSAEGVRPDRSEIMVPPEIIANGAAMQAVQTLQTAHAQGRKALRQLCERIAKRVPQEPKLRGMQRVEIVSTRYDPIAYFVSGPTPSERHVLHKCRVRSAP